MFKMIYWIVPKINQLWTLKSITLKRLENKVVCCQFTIYQLMDLAATTSYLKFVFS